MARRKNSAEMLDVLRRISTEDKARRVRQIQKEALEQARPEMAPAVPSEMAPREHGQASRLDPAPGTAPHAVPPTRGGEPLFGGSRLRRLDPLPAQEDETEATGRWRRSLLSVLSAVRSARVSGEDGAAAPDGGKANGEGRDALALAPTEVISLESRHMLTPAGGVHQKGAGGLHGAVGLQGAGAPGGANGPEGADWPPEGTRGGHSQKAGNERDAGGPREEPAAVPLSPLEPFQPSSAGGEIIRRPLFGFSRDEGGLRGILARATRKLVGEAISGGLRQRVEIRLVTLGLYAAVAVLAMLVVALILNSPGRDRERERNEKIIEGNLPDNPPGPPLPLEIVPPGRSVLPDVKNIVTEPAPQAKGVVGKSDQGSAPREATPPQTSEGRFTDGGPLDKVWTGQKGPPGWYVQVQGTVSPEHADLIIEHLKTLGFRSIWKRPQAQVQGSPTVDLYLIRLAPYATKEEAETAKSLFQKLIKQYPLKKPRVFFKDPFVSKYP